jgi:hydroxylamine reductase
MNMSIANLDDLALQLQKLLVYFVNSASMTDGLQNLLQVGTVNFEITKLLDEMNVKFNGVPQLTAIPTKLVPGPCILITGHDLVDLKTLLEKCEPKGINVYTHGEMLPSFVYPELKKYKCLVANYGHAWQLQQTEFACFPGPILFTTNCIMKPTQKYIQNCFTTGAVGYEGVKHIKNDEWDSLLQ